MNRRDYLKATGLIGAGSLAGCVESEDAEDTKDTENNMTEISNSEVLQPSGDGMGNDAKILKFVDEEAGTVVYAQLGAMGIKSGGMAAVPLAETTQLG